MLISIFRVIEHQAHNRSNLFEVLFFEAAGSSSRSTQTDAAGYKRAGRIKRNSIFIAGNANIIKQLFCFLTGQVFVAYINQNQMVVSTAGNKTEAFSLQAFGKSLGILP